MSCLSLLPGTNTLCPFRRQTSPYILISKVIISRKQQMRSTVVEESLKSRGTETHKYKFKTFIATSVHLKLLSSSLLL